ncbi:MAG: hypothetical protein K2H01_05155 [Ruminococcus sp.]|nr:hypothetical protein [Ruminococcus sp.]
MKRILTIITALLIAVSFTGCNIFKTAVKEAVEELSEKAKESRTAEVSENLRTTEYTNSESDSNKICTVGDISFEVPADWNAVSELEGSFISPDKKTAYQLQGESMLGSFTPKEFYDELVSSYSDSYNVIYTEDDVTPITSADGTKCFVGRIKMTNNNILFNIDVLAAPNKNTVLTFAAQCTENNEPDTDIREITKTVSFNIGAEDTASGRNFKISNGTEIHLNDDGSFKYFKNSDDADSSYFEGNYEVYYGQAAFDKLVSMSEYGLTEEELENILSANMNGYSVGGSHPMDYLENSETADGVSDKKGYRICKDTFYTIIMHTNVLVENGEVSDIDGTALYMGYYLPEIEEFDLLSVNTYTYTQWTEIQ